MDWNPVVTELTTGATDAVLGLEALIGAALLLRARGTDRFKLRLWLGILALLFVASALGAVAHGLDLGEGLRELLWQPLFLALGLMLGLIAVAAVHDRWGPGASRRALPVALVAALAFYGITLLAGGAFLVFVAYEACAMGLALVVYLQLARRGHPGSGLVTAGILVTLVAAIVQQTSWTVTLLWPFDHNGIFHLIQMPGLLLMVLGVRRSLRSDPRTDPTDSAGPTSS